MGSIFLDNLYVDLERLQRINNTIRMIPDDMLKNSDIPLRQVESMVISPSVEINKIAEQHAHTLPRTYKSLLSRSWSNATRWLCAFKLRIV